MSVQVLEDEVDKKAREIREKLRSGDLSADRTELKGADPNKRYRWANNRQRNRARREADGYVVTDPKGKTKAKHGYERDGAICLGDDLILMETSRERYIEKLATQKVKQERFEQAGIAEARDKINKLYRDEMKGKPHKDITFDESADRKAG